jgi:hypothetical protein
MQPLDVVMLIVEEPEGDAKRRTITLFWKGVNK